MKKRIIRYISAALIASSLALAGCGTSSGTAESDTLSAQESEAQLFAALESRLETAQTAETEDDTGTVPLRADSYDSEGTLTSYVESEYDAQEKLTKQSNYDADGKLSSYTVYEYDEQGHPVKYTYYDASDTVYAYTNLKNNSDGRLVKEEYYSTDDSDSSEPVLSIYRKYSYDDNGNVSRIETYDEDDNMTGYTEFTYDSDGNQTGYTYYDADGEKNEYGESVYENGNKISDTTYDADGKVLYGSAYKYDARGRLTQTLNTSEDGSSDGSISYEY